MGRIPQDAVRPGGLGGGFKALRECKEWNKGALRANFSMTTTKKKGGTRKRREDRGGDFNGKRAFKRVKGASTVQGSLRN